MPIEIVGILRRFLRFLLRLHHLTGNECIAAERLAYDVTTAFVLTHHFGNDILRPLEGRLHISHLTFHKPLGSLFGIRLPLHEQKSGQRLQTLFLRHGSPRPALGAEGQVDILQLRSVPAVINAFLQLGSHLLLFGNGLDDGFLPLDQFLQFVVHIGNAGDLYLVESSCAFFSIS